MRKLFIGLLLAATAASPALAGKGGHGGGHGNPHGGGKYAGAKPQGNPHGGGGNPHRAGNQHRGGGNPHAMQARGGRHGDQAMAFARPASRADSGGPGFKAERQRPRPAQVRIARFDDSQARKQWKRAAKDERKVVRQLDRRERFRPAERIARVEHHAPPRTIRYAPTPVVRYVERPAVRHVQPRVVRYVERPPVRYVSRSYAPVYQQPVWTPTYWGDGYDDYAPVRRYDQARYYGPTRYDAPASYAYAPTGYWPSGYSPVDPYYGSDYAGLFGRGGDGLLGALLPMVLQSMLGGDLGGSLGGLTGYGGLNGLYSPDVLPLQQASYAPYADDFGDTGLTSLLMPSLLGSGSLF
ncbi:hypothetical protein GON01_07515 [Sphingomonas sp. MAH-20]|uniref:RcnB family protein n=1 Tax=Sphingomonas horti TaxID=2682842 RepID=A0A6I4J2X6_9SPHN|nr:MULTISPECIES: hypothetical protein [Sphingomonas]MBA2919898.1 hypothetical protein [Sphingomonas sp. CGMCC 1.13658]MVO77781.1 hypothetical protein [Sphingomonas horti]